MSELRGHVVGMVYCWNFQKILEKTVPASKATKKIKRLLMKQIFELLEDLSKRTGI